MGENTSFEYPFEQLSLSLVTCKINPKGFSQKRTLFFTDFNVYVYKEKTFSSKLTLCKKYPVVSLIKVKYRKNNDLKLKFQDGKIVIRDKNNSDLILKCVISLVENYYGEGEANSIIFSTDLKPRYSNPNPKYKFAKDYIERKISIPIEEYSTIESFVNSSPSTVKMSSFTANMEQIFPTIGTVPTLSTLYIDVPIHINNLQYLTEFIRKAKNLSKIVITSQINQPVDKVFKDFSGNIQYVEFNEASGRFAANAIRSVLEYLQPTTLILKTMLLNKDSVESLEKELSKSKYNHPNTVIISGAHESILLCAPKLFCMSQELGITGSKGDLVEFFDCFSEIYQSNLRTLKVSGNTAKGEIDFAYLPPSCKFIDMSDTKANKEAINTIAVALDKLTIEIDLSYLQPLDISPEEAANILTEKNLTSLRFSGNCLTPEITKRLSSWPELTKLSICDCLDPKYDVRPIAELIESGHIEELDFSAVRRQSLAPEQTEIILKACGQSPALRVVRMRGIKLPRGQEVLVAEMCNANAGIEEVDYDFPGILEDDLTLFFSRLKARPQPVKINLPPRMTQAGTRRLSVLCDLFFDPVRTRSGTLYAYKLDGGTHFNTN